VVPAAVSTLGICAEGRPGRPDSVGYLTMQKVAICKGFLKVVVFLPAHLPTQNADRGTPPRIFYAASSFAPRIHSMTASRLLMRRHSAISTRREEPQLEHVKSRGNVSEAASPTWPHCWQEIRSIIWKVPVDSAGSQTSADGECASSRHGKEKGGRSRRLNFSSRFVLEVSAFEPTIGPRGPLSCRSSDVRCSQMRTFQLGHFGSECRVDPGNCTPSPSQIRT
jgi:hypothetical protein